MNAYKREMSNQKDPFSRDSTASKTGKKRTHNEMIEESNNDRNDYSGSKGSNLESINRLFEEMEGF